MFEWKEYEQERAFRCSWVMGIYGQVLAEQQDEMSLFSKIANRVCRLAYCFVLRDSDELEEVQSPYEIELDPSYQD